MNYNNNGDLDPDDLNGLLDPFKGQREREEREKKRKERIEKLIGFLKWLIGITITAVGVAVGIMQWLGISPTGFLTK